MNANPLVRVKTEPLDDFVEPITSDNVDEPIDLDDFNDHISLDEQQQTVLTDVTNSNVITGKCSECNDRDDYECSACLCLVCLHKTTNVKRRRCSSCQKPFHEWCIDNQNPVSPTGRWLCSKCEDTENRHSSSFKPRIQDVVTQESASKEAATKVDLSIVKSEKIDWNANSILNKSVELDPSLDSSYMDVKHKIVEKVARRFMKKMHHASRTKECVTVPRNHFGPIPGVSVGTCWRFRLQVSECGVHRPLVGGIHGRAYEGAYSIVLSGVYDDDQDFGDEFLYCGSGGRAKDPTKRYSAQIAHQKLDNVNRALALCCNAPLDDKEGGEAEDWRAGKPVRVIRNYRLRKHSTYAPEEGNRYDGIYKVVKYFPTIGKVGLIVWKFLMRRDDPEPAPWTEEGKRIIDERNLARVIWPEDFEDEDTQPQSKEREAGRGLKRRTSDYDSYNCADLNSLKVRFVKSEFGGSPIPVPMRHSITGTIDFDEQFDIKPDVNKLQANLLKRPGRRPRACSLNGSGSNFEFKVASVMSVNHSYNTRLATAQSKQYDAYAADASGLISATYESDAYGCLLNGVRIKAEPFELPKNVKSLVEEDTRNKSSWKKCKTYLKKGEVEFLKNVKITFECSYCSKLLDHPVTTPCEHNICLECITDHFSKNLFTCPDCGFDLGSSFKLTENKNLTNVLQLLFPSLGSYSTKVV